MSRAYVHAIAAAARVNLRMQSEFDYGFDGQFDSIVTSARRNSKGDLVTRHVNAGFPIDFQLKCTWKWEADATDIYWSIKTKAYNDLVERPPEAVAVMLVLMCLPESEGDWVAFSEDAMLLRKCCYFTKLTGSPTDTDTSTKQLKIPRSSLLNAESLSIALADERSRRKGLFI